MYLKLKKVSGIDITDKNTIRKGFLVDEGPLMQG